MNRDDTNFYLWITFVSNHDDFYDFSQQTVIFPDRFWSTKSICSLRASHNPYILYQRYLVNITTSKSRGRISILLFKTLMRDREKKIEFFFVFWFFALGIFFISLPSFSSFFFSNIVKANLQGNIYFLKIPNLCNFMLYLWSPVISSRSFKSDSRLLKMK